MKLFSKSLSRKIISLLLLGVILLSTFSFFFGRYYLNDYMGRHYSQIDRSVSLGTHFLLQSWLEHESYTTLKTDQHLIQYFRDMIEEMNFEAIYLVLVKDDSNIGKVFLRIDGNSILTDVNSVVADYEYELDPYEVEMAKGQRTSYEAVYESTYGTAHAFFSAVPIDDGYSILVGFIMKEYEYDRIVVQMALRMYGAMAVGFLVLILLLSYFFRKLVTKRIALISSRMKNYVENGKLSDDVLEIKGNDEIAQMEEAFNQMTMEIRDYIEQKDIYEGERRKVLAEMGIAASIQQGLISDPHYEDELVLADGYMKPARNVGGDFFSYHRLPNGKFVFGIGDVSGKGMSAAMFMSSITSVLRYSSSSDEDPARILTNVNQFACQENTEQMFVTVFVGVYDPSTRIVTYSSAGHNPPYLVGSEVRRLDEAQGMLLGIFEDEEYTNSSLTVEPGSTLVMYTDGVTEAINEKEEFYKEEHLVEVLKDGQKDSDAEKQENPIFRRVLDSVRDFVGQARQVDDITVLTVLFKEEAEHLSVPASLSEMKKIKDFFLRQPRIPASFRKKIMLVVEELFVNTASYGYEEGKTGTVEFDLQIDDSGMTLVMKDDARAYDPLESVIDPDDYDVDTQIGGLGKFIAFEIMDDTRYEYRDGRNILTMKKSF